MAKIEGYGANPRKNHWRRWQWNRIVERLAMLGIKPRDAIVLYLAAKDDADRKEAIRRGFHIHNLIAVDREIEVVKKLRFEGVNAICGDFFEAAKAFSCAHVYIADLCCGLEKKVSNFFESTAIQYTTRNNSTSVFSVNMQRGRDGMTKAARILSTLSTRGENSKHRGEILVGQLRLYADPRIFRKIAADYYSYKAQRVHMDSTIFMWTMPKQLESNLRHEVAAAKAIRTQRLNGTLRRAA